MSSLTLCNLSQLINQHSNDITSVVFSLQHHTLHTVKAINWPHLTFYYPHLKTFKPNQVSMISKEQASKYLEDVLEMPNNWRDILESDKVEFLRVYMRHHATKIPFQNISMAATPPEKRFNPDEATLIKVGLSGIGGCCLNLNFFAKILLRAIGLDAHAIIGTHAGAPIAGTHCMVIVNTNDVETYLVEVGGSFPILEPVPMHKLPFRILAAGGFPYEFRQVSEGMVGRFHIGGGLLAGKYVDKEEALRTTWDLIPRDLSEFEHPMTQVFTNPIASMLLNCPYMYRFFTPKEYRKIFPMSENGEERITTNGNNNRSPSEIPTDFVFIFKRRVIIGDAFSRKVVKEYDSYDELVPDILKYFPTLCEKEVLLAIEQFKKRDTGHPGYDKVCMSIL